MPDCTFYPTSVRVTPQHDAPTWADGRTPMYAVQAGCWCGWKGRLHHWNSQAQKDWHDNHADPVAASKHHGEGVVR